MRASIKPGMDRTDQAAHHVQRERMQDLIHVITFRHSRFRSNGNLVRFNLSSDALCPEIRDFIVARHILFNIRTASFALWTISSLFFLAGRKESVRDPGQGQCEVLQYQALVRTNCRLDVVKPLTPQETVWRSMVSKMTSLIFPSVPDFTMVSFSMLLSIHTRYVSCYSCYGL